MPETSANAGTASQEGAYLAGVLAAKTSESGNLGIVISADDTNWNKQAGGFVAGARSENPNVEIELAQIGQAGYADTAGGKRVTEAVIADGADVVFGMGDGSSFGMLQAVEAADGVTFIDVIGDKTAIDDQGVLLSSVLWSFDGLYQDAIDDIGAGTFGEEGYELDLENGGISLLRTDHIDDADLERARGHPAADHRRRHQGAADRGQVAGRGPDRTGLSGIRAAGRGPAPRPAGDLDVAAENENKAGTQGPPLCELRGITKAFPGVLANDGIDLDAARGRGPRAARRERRRQVDADQHPLRDVPARRGRDPLRGRARSRSIRRARRSSSGSAPSTST